MIDAFLKFMDSDDSLIGPVNLGNPSEFTILELAELVLEITNSKSTIVFKDLPFDDPRRRKPDISLAKEKLNWKPKIDLKRGLMLTIDYFDSVIK